MTGNTAEARVNYDAPYKDPEQAISIAYKTEARDIVKVSSLFAEMRGGTVSLKQAIRLNPFEHHAQAAMTLAFVARHLTTEQFTAIRARYTVASCYALEARKRRDMSNLYRFVLLYRKDAPYVPLRYAEDVLRGWVWRARHHDDMWWADHMDVDMRTLRRWRNGDPNRRRIGFVQLLDGYHDDAIGRLIDPMFAAGLTRE